MKQKIISIITRFAKGFLAGGISSVLASLNAGASFSSFSDLKQFGGSLAIAFITGALLATEKMVNWDESDAQTPVIPVNNASTPTV